jgi:uncharacterized SAM-binding protein YcdF (DUF218 family)
VQLVSSSFLSTLSLRHLAHFLLNPLTICWLALLVGLFLYYRGTRGVGQGVLVGAVTWFFLISVSPLPLYLVGQRESRFPVLWEIPEQSVSPHILVLGGGHSVSPDLPPNDQLSDQALVRLSEGIRLKQQRPDAKLIGSGNSMSNRTPQAAVLMHTAVALGISPRDTLHNSRPYNTETEAFTYARRFGTDRSVVLVTSALHMPRAVFWFRQAGIDIMPAPIDHWVKPDPQRSPYHWKPSAAKIQMTGALLHEWAGMTYAKWKTR